MATPQRWGIREVALATFYDIATGKALVQLDTLKTSGIENKGKVVYATGARGNAKLIGWSSDREATLKLQDAIFTNQVIAMMTGNALGTGAVPVYKRDVLTPVANAATLSTTPAATGALISVFKLNADGTHGAELTYNATVATGKYAVATKAITFFAGDVTAGSSVVAYYKTATDVTANQIVVSSNSFAGSFKVVLDCLVRDYVTKTDYAAQIEIFNAKMADDWNLAMEATGEPQAYDIPLEILKPAVGTQMYTMTIYDAALVV